MGLNELPSGLLRSAGSRSHPSLSLRTDLVVLAHAPGEGVDLTIPVSGAPGILNTKIGFSCPHEDRESWDGFHPELITALTDAWLVEVFDPVWGRNDLL